MAELRLVFQPMDTTMTVRVDLIKSDNGISGGQPQPFAFQLNSDNYTDLRWYLEEFMDLPIGGSVVRANRIEQSLTQWGRDLYKSIFNDGNHRDLLRDLINSKPPRLLTIATSNGDILRLPWELMADERGALTRRNVTIRRQLETVKQNLAYRVGSPLRVLLIVSRPDDAGFIDPRHSTRAILDALKSLQGNVTVEFCRPPTLARLEEMLAESNGAYDIVHFDGHGNYNRLLGLGVLLFEKIPRSGQVRVEKDPVQADRLGNLLAGYNIPLVILEACRTSEVDDVAFRSVAPRLIEAGVGSVLAMSYAVHVEAAKILIERFYRELARGHTIGQAMESGRAALMAQPDRWLEYGPQGKTIQLQDWFLPQLYQRGNDMPLAGSMVPADATQKSVKVTMPNGRPLFPTGNQVGAFPYPPLYNFHGRARELYNLERAFRTDQAILLHAMGGMGKTTLANETALWLTQTGMFREGSCFLSFEQPVTAERIALVLGSYLEGHRFEALSQAKQLERARQLFQENDILMVWDNFESLLETVDTMERGSRSIQDSTSEPSDISRRTASEYTADERTRIIKLFRNWTEDSAGRGRLLITCRPQEAGLPGVRRMELSGLARSDTLYLLAKVLRKHDMSLDDERFDKDNLDALLDVLADHPLSIELVGPHLKKLTPEQIIADFRELLDRFAGDAEVERNRSLLASLRFSTNRLSAQAQTALAWLGLFHCGVFEQLLLDVSQMEPVVWEVVRAELEATALVRVETDIPIGGRPYLRFHPTLSYAVGRVIGVDTTAGQAGEDDDGLALSEQEEVRQRFMAVYDKLAKTVSKLYFGSAARGGVEMLAREEGNVRTAIQWAVEADRFDVAAAMLDAFHRYLRHSARLRELDRWLAWLAEVVTQSKFSETAAAVEQERARLLFAQRYTAEAIGKLEALIERLRHTTEFDPAFQLAHSQMELARIYIDAGHAERAIPLLTEAMSAWEQLVKQAANLSPSETFDDLFKSDEPEAKRRRETCAQQLVNLVAVISDLANALRKTGHLNDALSRAEQVVKISRIMRNERSFVVGLGQTAGILMEQGYYRKADARYRRAMEIIRHVGDKGLEALCLQDQGKLARLANRCDRALDLYKQALKLFQEMSDEANVMRTYNLLGLVEQQAGRLSEARAWYERSREIARLRGDTVTLGDTTQNLGIVCRDEGNMARQCGDEETAQQRYKEAERFLQEALQIRIDRQEKPGEAKSQLQLSAFYLQMGELNKAEGYARRVRETCESLAPKDLYLGYHLFAEVARAQGDETQAVEWEAKRDEMRAELSRRARGSNMD